MPNHPETLFQRFRAVFQDAAQNGRTERKWLSFGAGMAMATQAGMLLLALALATLVGLALGLLGGGGSILTLPILRYALGMGAREAIATSLIVVSATSLAALVPHARRGRVRWGTGIVFGLSGMLGAYIAARGARFIPEPVLLLSFGLMMFGTSLAMLRRGAHAQDAPATRAASAKFALHKVVAEGLVVGAVTGVVGAGGGFLVVPALVLFGGVPMPSAIGTSLLVIAMKSVAGLAGFLGHTQVDWVLAGYLVAAAVSGSVAGAALTHRLTLEALRKGFGWFVMSMAFFVLAQELPPLWGGSSSLPLALLSAALGSSVAAGVVASRRYVARARAAARLAEAGMNDVTTPTTGRFT